MYIHVECRNNLQDDANGGGKNAVLQIPTEWSFFYLIRQTAPLLHILDRATAEIIWIENRIQSYDSELQRQRLKNLQLNE
jgi:hypothetical protein